MHPRHFRELELYRGARSVPKQGAVCDGKPRTLNFTNGMGSSTADEGRLGNAKPGSLLSVACDGLGAYAKRAGITKVDFMSIDVEGVELEVLSSFDWSIPVQVAVIEVFQQTQARCVGLKCNALTCATEGSVGPDALCSSQQPQLSRGVLLTLLVPVVRTVVPLPRPG
jgi:hypothetical protein